MESYEEDTKTRHLQRADPGRPGGRGGQAFARGDPATGLELDRRGMQEIVDAGALAPDSLQTRIPRGAILLGAARFVDDSIAHPILDLRLADYDAVFELHCPY